MLLLNLNLQIKYNVLYYYINIMRMSKTFKYLNNKFSS